MQNKKILQILIVLVGIVCLYELSFTFFAKSFEAEATEEGRSKEEATKWLKEHASDELWLGLNYLEVKKREINLGLDLRGGISVALALSLSEFEWIDESIKGTILFTTYCCVVFSILVQGLTIPRLLKD